ncbi:MAG: tRNA (adenosine(37)-N6)-threonylcarbamoyltransferase complex dimerization subunit type 1 TsaB [candidate division Zixibacteria bacterium]|nr:tRNA (adenosine(37)-N6)-threonylcarbamoyltransferase complex dimerization subunit type 1 TsaB [candidate division Zixibacteria bacterium]
MPVLGIDSSTDKLSVGLAEADAVIAEKMIASSFEHASHIIGLIDSVLTESSYSIKDLSGVAVAIGPGSFTGLRIGLAVAKGITVAMHIPIIGVSTFEVLSHRLSGRFERFYLAAPARRGEYYLCRVEPETTIREHIALTGEDELVDKIGAWPAGLVGREPSGEWTRIAHLIPPEDLVISGGELARMGAKWFGEGRADDPATLEPLYIAPSQAERRFGQK